MHHGLHHDETSYLCQWQLPEAHYLEAWSNARAYDGTESLVQPLIEPLYEGRSAHEVVALVAKQLETPGARSSAGIGKPAGKIATRRAISRIFGRRACTTG